MAEEGFNITKQERNSKMKFEKQKELRADLQLVFSKYGLRNWAFCGEDKPGYFIGGMAGKQPQGGHMLTIVNIGRLWQYARQTCRELLDSYEKLS